MYIGLRWDFIYNYIRNRKKGTKIEKHIAPGKTYYSSSRVDFGGFII